MAHSFGRPGAGLRATSSRPGHQPGTPDILVQTMDRRTAKVQRDGSIATGGRVLDTVTTEQTRSARLFRDGSGEHGRKREDHYRADGKGGNPGAVARRSWRVSHANQ